MQRKNWKIKEITTKAYNLAEIFNISAVTAQVLLNRNINESEFYSFLKPSISKLHPPSLLPDMDKAVKRIKEAINNGEKLFIVGDYDVDGITSLAIFYEFIKDYPNRFHFYIPHRIKNGYGLNVEAIKEAKQKNTNLIICFDCGTNSIEEIKLANSSGIDVIIIDHHHPKDNLTNSFAFINPKRKDSNYPFPDLSSAAISFKLLQALKGNFSYEILDLVALSLVCDVVPVYGENRILLKEGLKAIRQTKRPSIKALCDVSNIKQKNIDTFHIGYILGPRINASGRVAYAKESLDIFLTEEEEKAYNIALKLQEYNQLRKKIELEILEEAQSIIERELINDYALVVYRKNWHPGVLGIVASHLTEKYYRPSFVFSFDENIAKGSARSIQPIHLVEILDKCSYLLKLYGGHKRAAGIQIIKENLNEFKDKINSIIKEHTKFFDFIPILEIDAKLYFKDISIKLTKELKSLEPYGEENSKPIFATFEVSKKTTPKKINNYYSLWITDGNITYEGIIYDKELLDIVEFAHKFDIAYSIDWNNYYNTFKLIIKDIHIS